MKIVLMRMKRSRNQEGGGSCEVGRAARIVTRSFAVLFEVEFRSWEFYVKAIKTGRMKLYFIIRGCSSTTIDSDIVNNK